MNPPQRTRAAQHTASRTPVPGRFSFTSVQRPLTAAFLLAAAFAAAAATTILLGSLLRGAPGTVLLAESAAAALVARRASGPAPALVIAPVFWLFHNGFVEHHAGVLGWQSGPDAEALACLLGASMLPWLAEAVLGLLTASRRFRTVRLLPFEPEEPPSDHPSYWN